MGRLLRIGFLALLAILILLESARALVGTLGHISITLGAAGPPASGSAQEKGTPSGLSLGSGRPSQTPSATSTPSPIPTATRTAGISTPEGFELAGTATEALPPISTLYALATSDGRRVPWVERYERKRPAREPVLTQQPVQPSTPLPGQDPSQLPQPTNAPPGVPTNAPVETQPPPTGEPGSNPTEAPPPLPTGAPVDDQPPAAETGDAPTQAPPPPPTNAPQETQPAAEGPEGIPTDAPPEEG